MPKPVVDIEQTGRGGGITYREGLNSVSFSWEFGGEGALALIFGPTAKQWDQAFPWAKGRQEEIYQFVGSDVVRQKADGYAYEYDLDAGTMDIVKRRANPAFTQRASEPVEVQRPQPKKPDKRSAAWDKFMDSVVPVWKKWEKDQHYDLKAAARLSPKEREEMVEMLTARDVTWREIEALAAIDSPKARAAVKAGLTHHLSIETRLAAAEALKAEKKSFDLESVLANQIRALDKPGPAMERALTLAEEHDSPVIRQALLWASYNCTDCAPPCARLLVKLAKVKSDKALQDVIDRLRFHNSSTDRGLAFDELSRRLGMELDTTQGQ